MARSLFAYILPLIAAGFVLQACGGKSFDSGGDGPSAGTTNGGSASGGTSSQGGSASGGKSQGGSHTGGTAAGGMPVGGAGGVGGATQCDAYLNEQGSNVPVLLINETSQPIYLGQQMLGCGLGSLFTVSDASGAPLASPGFCSPTCQEIMRGEIIGCPAIACIAGGTLTLQPGESATQLWNASFMAQVTLPPACRPAPDAAGCQRIVAAKPGVFTFSAQAGTKQDCSQFGTGTCGPCTPDSNGGCTTFGALIAAPLISAEVKLMLDGSYGIGGPGGGGMVRSVEIVFKN